MQAGYEWLWQSPYFFNQQCEELLGANVGVRPSLCFRVLYAVPHCTSVFLHNSRWTVCVCACLAPHATLGCLDVHACTKGSPAARQDNHAGDGCGLVWIEKYRWLKLQGVQERVQLV